MRVPPEPRHGPNAGWSLGIASLLVAAWFLWLGNVGLGLSDEGFLWYGATRTLLGDVPLRDFQSYEPGRYYWAAAAAWLLGPGILALRASVAAFLALGLSCGLQVAGRVVVHPAWRFATALVLLAWSFPRHKLFEPALAMAAVWIGVRLAERPDWRRHLQAGAFVGLALFFGRNHALYAGLGLSAVLLWSRWKRSGPPLARSIGAFAGGGVIGALPFLAMLIWVPGFAESFLNSLLFFVRHGANLPLPFPWPWRVLPGLSGVAAAGPLAISLVFVLGPLVIAAGLWIAWRGDAEQPAVRVVAVASLVGLFYAHHAVVRSDASHLAQAIPPVLLAVLAMPKALEAGWRASAAVWGSVALLSGAVGLIVNTEVAPALWRKQVTTRVGADVLRVPAPLARAIAGLERSVGEHVPRDAPLLIVPYTPGLYPILKKQAPIWSLYLLWPATAKEQREMLRTLDQSHVDWVLVWDRALGSENLRFRNTYPIVWKHLQSHFERVRDRRLPRAFLLLHRLAERPPGARNHSGRRTSPRHDVAIGSIGAV